jgi:hypothetical protein
MALFDHQQSIGEEAIMAVLEREKRRVKVGEKKRGLIRDAIWPDLEVDRLWLRLKSTGFITIPRTLPLIMEIINCMTKGAPAGTAYFELWCRSFDECFVDMDDQEGMAFSNGFTGQRAVSTWRGRIRALQELGFIDVQIRGGKSYALLYNPYQVIYRHRQAKTPGLTGDHYTALEIRVAGIGATDLNKEAKKIIEADVEAEKRSALSKPPRKVDLSTVKANK